jgi:hypothetical protein
MRLVEATAPCLLTQVWPHSENPRVSGGGCPSDIRVLACRGYSHAQQTRKVKAKWRNMTVGGLTMVVVSMSALAWWGSREPIYRSKPLSFWLSELGSSDADSVRTPANAVRVMGSKAVRFLTQAIDRQTLILYPRYRTIWAKVPSVVERRLPRPESRSEVLNESFLALTLIGPPAIPALARALQNRDDTVRFYATISLAVIGEPAIPALIVQLNARDARTRQATTRVLGLMGPQANTAAPVVERLLQDPSAEVRTEADLALQAIISETYDARIRLLARVAGDPARNQVWQYALGLSRLLAPQVGTPVSELMLLFQPQFLSSPSLEVANAAILPTLVTRLGDSNPSVRIQAAAALGRVKWSSLLADLTLGPAVMEQLNGTNPVARQEAAFVYWRQKGSALMIEILIGELQNASNLETGTRILGHFAEMGDALKPFIPSIANIVNRSAELRSLSNQVSRLTVKTN